MGLQQPVNRCFGYEVALLVGEAHRQLAGAQIGLLQRHLDDLLLDIGDCQEFRVWAGIMGKKESHYVPTQRTCDPQ